MTISHTTPADGNVFRDLGFAPGDAVNLKIRADLMIAIRRRIEIRGLTQAQAAELLGTTEPQVSELVRGKIEQFTIESLVKMVSNAGVHVGIRVSEADA